MPAKPSGVHVIQPCQGRGNHPKGVAAIYIVQVKKKHMHQPAEDLINWIRDPRARIFRHEIIGKKNGKHEDDRRSVQEKDKQNARDDVEPLKCGRVIALPRFFSATEVATHQDKHDKDGAQRGDVGNEVVQLGVRNVDAVNIG